MLDEVRDFVALARSGAYLMGDRRVPPRERTRWRFTFQRLARNARDVLCRHDVEAGANAMELLIELACEMRSYDYFRSEDPLEAAGFVVSEAAALLWTKVKDNYGIAGLADRAPRQLIRWESLYGWTRSGDGRVSRKESTLAGVLAVMLLGLPEMWIIFADRYLEALDEAERDDASRPLRARPSTDKVREERTRALAEWHLLLLTNLNKADGEQRLQRLTRHSALGGPALTFLGERVAHRYRDLHGGPGGIR